MNKNNSSFPLFLSIILGLLFLGSIVFSYFFGNFGGISVKELNENYLLKDELRFKDLPKNIQNKYMSKQKLNFNISNNPNISKAFDDEGNPITVQTDNIDDFQDIVKSLQERVLFLEKQNLFLSNDKEELLKIVEQEKAKNSTDHKKLLSNNLEKINEAEQQHYKNISRLTSKINDLQRDNILLSQQLNNKDEILKTKSKDFNKVLEEQKKAALEHEKEVLKVLKLKYLSIDNQNKSLQQKLDLLNNNINLQKSSSLLETEQKNQQIVDLQNKINSLMLEKHDLLTQKSKSVLELEKKTSDKLKEFERIINNNNSEKEAIKRSYKATIEKLESKYNQLINEKNTQIHKISSKLEDEKQNNLTLLDKNTKVIKEQKNKYKMDLDKNLNQIKQLNTQIGELKLEKEKLQKNLNSDKSEILASKDKILQLQDKIKTLDKNDRNIDVEIEQKVQLNDQKNNENYKILNEKIANLEQKLSVAQSSNIKVLESAKDEKAGINQKLTTAYKQNDRLRLQIQKLQKKADKLSKEKEHLQLSENEKLIEIKKSFESLKQGNRQQEKEYNTIIVNLKQEIENKNTELSNRLKDKEKLGKYLRNITALKKMLKKMNKKVTQAKKTSSSTKLVKVDSVECDDMNSGNFKISSTCKAKVDRVLSKYSTKNFFEIIPIVGPGGFASLNLIKRKSTLGIPDKEIERLTNLANLGLGKYRSKEAGWLIREKFGDNVKLSYAVYNIEEKNKKGFVIRVYK